METAPHKIYVDARAKKEGTNSNFTWSPGRPFYIDRCKAFIDSVHIPSVFQTIDNTNRYLYVYEDVGPGYPRKITLNKGQYTLAELVTEVQTQLNTGTNLDPNSYLVAEDNGYLGIGNNTFGATFSIRTEWYLDEVGFPGHSAPWYSCEEVLGFTGNRFYVDGDTGESHVNLQRHHTLFINSSLGTHNDSVGPVGQSTIARKVVVDAPYGSMVHDFHSSGLDYVFCEKQSISGLNFRLTDWKGQEVEMDLPWSLSIIFFPMDEVL